MVATSTIFLIGGFSAVVGTASIIIFQKRHSIIHMTRKAYYDAEDVVLANAYRFIDSDKYAPTPEKRRRRLIQDKTDKGDNQRIITREEWSTNTWGEERKIKPDTPPQITWFKNPDLWDVRGVDTREPKAPKRIVYLWSGMKDFPEFTVKNGKRVIILGSSYTNKNIKSKGFTPSTEIANEFANGVAILAKVDNRKRKWGQQLRPMPYHSEKAEFPEWASKMNGDADHSALWVEELPDFHEREKEWCSRDPTVLNTREIEAIVVDTDTYGKLVKQANTGKIPKKVIGKLAVYGKNNYIDSTGNEIKPKYTTQMEAIEHINKKFYDPKLLSKNMYNGNAGEKRKTKRKSSKIAK